MSDSKAPQTTNPSPVPAVSEDPGKTLGIVGFILAFFVSIVGIILSAIALSKSKKAGYTNGLALAGVIVGSVVTLVWSIFIIMAISLAITITSTVLERCQETTRSTVIVEGETFTCPSTY